MYKQAEKERQLLKHNMKCMANTMHEKVPTPLPRPAIYNSI